MDSQLVQIARVAEQGHTLPMMRVIAGGTIVSGTPGPTGAFMKCQHDALHEEVAPPKATGLPTAGRKRATAEREASAAAWADQAIAPLRNAIRPEADPT